MFETTHIWLLLPRQNSEECDAHVRLECLQQGVSSAAPSKCQPDTISESSGHGLLGLGDQDYPISQEMFEKCSQSKAFVQQLSNMWRRLHSETLTAGTMESPGQSSFDRCSTFCKASALCDVDEALFGKCQGLLTNICRSLKTLYRQVQKQISSVAKHPLLLARYISSDESVVRTQGWIVTRVTFSPYSFDAIELCLPACIDSGCEAEVTLKTSYAYSSSLCMFNFRCFNQVSTDMAMLGAGTTGGYFQYCFNPSYRFHRANDLTSLMVGRIDWVSSYELSADLLPGPDSDSESQDDIDIEDECDDIANMVGKLVGAPAAKKKGKPKTRTTKPKKGILYVL